MKFKLLFVLVICSLCIFGCATHRQSPNVHDDYSSMALTQDTYKVSYEGGRHDSQNTVQSFLWKRCAELTLAHGYRYFVIINSNTDINTSGYQTPTIIDSDSYGDSSDNGIKHAHIVTTVRRGNIFKSKKYESTVIIKMLNTNTGAALIFDAKIIANQADPS